MQSQIFMFCFVELSGSEQWPYVKLTWFNMYEQFIIFSDVISLFSYDVTLPV